MSGFFKVVGAVVVLFFILSLLPSFYINTEHFLHWLDVSDWAGNLLGLAISMLVFFIIGCVLFSVFAGIFVVVAMVFAALILAGLTAVWPLVLIIAVAYYFSRKKPKELNVYR